jgi:hypothetical protein
MERLDQIIDKVELVMIHLSGQNESAEASTFVMKILRMFEAYESVSLAVNYEGRAAYLLDIVYIPEAIIDNILKKRTSLLLHNLSDAFEG